MSRDVCDWGKHYECRAGSMQQSGCLFSATRAQRAYTVMCVIVRSSAIVGPSSLQRPGLPFMPMEHRGDQL